MGIMHCALKVCVYAFCHSHSHSSLSPVLYVPGRKSSKNNLIHNGNRYCLNKRRKDRTYWRCIVKGCYGRVTIKDGKVLKFSSHSSHPLTASRRDYLIGEKVLGEDVG